jgi:hypothetical protein
MDNYRLLAQKDEIFKMVKKAPVAEIGEIWQTLPFKREVYRIKNLDILNEAMIFLTTLPFEFDKDFPVYIRLNYKNLVFKLSPQEYLASKNQLSCCYPKEAKAIEDRSKERTRLPKKSSLKVTLRSLSAETALDIKVGISDISEIGMGIVTSGANKEFFSRNSNFIIVKVCGREHFEQTVLSVRHISNNDDRSYISIGLLGSHTFSDRIFQVMREEMKQVKYAEVKGLK